MVNERVFADDIYPVSQGPDIICFGGEDWWYKNRAHNDMQFMRQYARTGNVLYINSIVMQKPRLTEGSRFMKKLVRKVKSIANGLKKGDGGFWVYSPFSIPLHHIRLANVINEKILGMQVSRVGRKLGMREPIYWVACPAACDAALRLRKNKLVYQRTDRYEEFPNVDYAAIAGFDRKLKAAADLTLFANSSLYEQERVQCRRALFIDHGVDYELFSEAEKDSYRPDDILKIPRPIVGFFGAIDDHTFDVAFMEKLVVLLPEISFVLVGNPSSNISGLLNQKNIWFLGQKSYEQIPHYGKLFDVAIMPWRQNRWIEGCNPIKLKEYLALGKPIVSTPFSELKKYNDVVYEARLPAQFAECVKRALVEDCPKYISARKAKVADNTWTIKAETVLKELFQKPDHYCPVNDLRD